MLWEAPCLNHGHKNFPTLFPSERFSAPKEGLSISVQTLQRKNVQNNRRSLHSQTDESPFFKEYKSQLYEQQAAVLPKPESSIYHMWTLMTFEMFDGHEN
jgi:hypothetical protein